MQVNPTWLNKLNRWARKPEFILVAICLILWGWTYGLWDLQGPDEGRYVQVARELLGRGNWLMLTVQGEPYDQKPPLPFWMFAAMLWLAGGEVSAWAVRLPSVLAGIVTVLCIHSIGRKRFGPRVGMIAALLFLTSPLVIKQAPTARLDMLFTAWIAVAYRSWMAVREHARPGERRTLIFWLALAGAFFTKGPLAFVLILSGPLLESWRVGHWRPWRSLFPTIGLSLVMTMVTAWLAAQVLFSGGDFVQGQVWGETWERLRRGAHSEPFWYYAKSFFGGVFMPWMLVFPFVVWMGWKHRKSMDGPKAWPLWVWFVVPLVLLHAATGKRHQYLLPLLPPLAILTAMTLDRYVWNRPLMSWGRGAAAGLLVCIAVAAASAAFLAEERAEIFWARMIFPSEFGVMLMVVFAVFAGVLSWMAWRARNAGRLVMLIVCVMIGAGVVLLGAIQPATNSRNTSRLFARSIEATMRNDETVIGAMGDATETKYHVYGNYDVRPFSLKKTANDVAARPRLIVATEDDARAKREDLKTAGYEQIYSLTVDDDPMTLFRRRDAVTAANPAKIRFAVVGDTGTGDRHARAVGREMSRAHDADGLDGVILLGDNIYGSEPFPESFMRRLLGPFEPMFQRRVPFHAILGNHDYDEEMIHQLESPLLGMHGREYYTLRFGGLATFFMACSDSMEKDPKQRAWLDREVKKSNTQWKILMIHEPLDASDVDDGPNEELYAILKNILTGPDGVDFVFAGSNHLYERRAPRAGVTHVTLGLGGKLADDEEFKNDPNRLAAYNDARGFGILDISRAEIMLRVINEHGKEVDRAVYPASRQYSAAGPLPALQTD